MNLKHVVQASILAMGMLVTSLGNQLNAQTRLTNFEGAGSQLYHHFVEVDNQSYHVTIDIFDNIFVYRFNLNGSRELIRCDHLENASESNFQINEYRYIFQDDGILEYNYITGETDLFVLPDGFTIQSPSFNISQLSQIKNITIVENNSDERYYIGFDPKVGFVTEPFKVAVGLSFMGDYKVALSSFDDSNVYVLTSIIDGSIDTIVTDNITQYPLFYNNNEIHYLYNDAVYHFQHQLPDIKRVDIQTESVSQTYVVDDIGFIYVIQIRDVIEISQYSKPNYQLEYYKEVSPGLGNLEGSRILGHYLYVPDWDGFHVINIEKDTHISQQTSADGIPRPFNDQGDIINHKDVWRDDPIVKIVNAENSTIEELTFIEPIQNFDFKRFVTIGDKVIFPYFTINTTTKEIYSNDLDLTFGGYKYNGVSLSRIKNSLLVLGEEAIVINDSFYVLLDSITIFNKISELNDNALFYDERSEEVLSWNGESITYQGQADDFNLDWGSREEDYNLLSDCLIYNASIAVVFHSLTTDSTTMSEVYDDYLYALGVYNDYAYYSLDHEILRVNCDGNFESIYTSQDTIPNNSGRSFFYNSEDLALLGTEDGVLLINSDNSVEAIDTVDFHFTSGDQWQDGSHALHHNRNSTETLIYNDGEFLVADIGEINKWKFKYLGGQIYSASVSGIDTFYSAIKDELFDFDGLTEDFRVVNVFQRASDWYVAGYSREININFQLYIWNKTNKLLTRVAGIAFDSNEYFEEFHTLDNNCMLMTTQRIFVIDDLWNSFQLNNIKSDNYDSQLIEFNGKAYFFAVDPKYGKQLYELDFSQDFNVQDNASDIEYVTVFPNPSSSSISLKGQMLLHNRYTIYNALGQVSSLGLVGNQMDISQLAIGQYFIVISKGNERYFGKFIKQ